MCCHFYEFYISELADGEIIPTENPAILNNKKGFDPFNYENGSEVSYDVSPKQYLKITNAKGNSCTSGDENININFINEYKNEAFGLFEELINNLKIDVSKIFSRMRLREKQNQTSNENSVSEKINKSAIKTKKISRNAPCPCGSGKKYKHCCGKIN